MQVSRMALVIGLALSSLSAAAATWQVDPNHSAVVFRVTHLGVSAIYGRFNEVAGTITTDDANALTGVSLDVKATSVDTGVSRRDTHLRTPDFFNVAQFPLIKFRSTAVAAGDTDGSFRLTGNLTLHGVTKLVTLNVQRLGTLKDSDNIFHIGGEGSLVIKRSDYGMTGLLDSAGDEIRLTLAFEALRS